MPGFVSLVGVGPGDPGLLTLRGRRAIAAADTLLVDALVHPGVLRHARPDAEQLFVGKRGDQSSTGQEEINHMLLLRASQGRRVARLKGGDALIFGRGAEEAEFLAEHGIAFEVIPGVSAAIGATAYAGIPLTHREHSSSVALVTSRERPGRPADQGPLRAVASADTIVIFMGLRRLATDLATLIDSGRDPSTPAAIISAGTHPEQVVVTGTLADLPDRAATADVRSPALVVIGEVVRLRERLRWWDGPGLHGRRVLVARAAEQSAETADAFVDLGATVVEIPMIRVGDPSRPEELSVALRAMAAGRYDVVAFTSANGVRRTFAALRSLGLDARAFGRARVAAVGPETARALSDSGITSPTRWPPSTGESRWSTPSPRSQASSSPGARCSCPARRWPRRGSRRRSGRAAQRSMTCPRTVRSAPARRTASGSAISGPAAASTRCCSPPGRPPEASPRPLATRSCRCPRG